MTEKSRVRRSMTIGLWIALLMGVGFAYVDYCARFFRQDMPIQHILRNISDANIGRTCDHETWRSYVHGTYPAYRASQFPQKYITEKENPVTIALLQLSDDLHTVPIGNIDDNADIVIQVDPAVLEIEEERHQYCFIPSTGELGWRNMWVTTPPEFQKWMRQFVSRIHKMPPRPKDACQDTKRSAVYDPLENRSKDLNSYLVRPEEIKAP